MIGPSIARSAAADRSGEVAIESLTQTATRRIPDLLSWSERTLLEVKNVAELGWTNQLRDFAAYAVQHDLDFQIVTRVSTVVDPGLEGFMREAGFTIARVLPG